MKIDDLGIKIFADGADIEGMKEMNQKGFIGGFTTNPTLMKKAGISDYVKFAKKVVEEIKDKPISFEVFSDDFDVMEKEAKEISTWATNIFVKIPITNSKGESSIPIIKKLSEAGLKLNVTAIFTIEQVNEVVNAFAKGTTNYVSVFAGRIADTGVDPVPVMKEVAEICKKKAGTMSLWASCREVYNIIQADECDIDVITVTNDVLNKVKMLGKDLEELSLETVNMFVNDGRSLGFSILQ